jgi:hypothetical protein
MRSAGSLLILSVAGALLVAGGVSAVRAADLGDGAPSAARAAPAGDAAAAKEESWSEPKFDPFWLELRSALAQHDAAAMALLVEFPLQLRYPDGSSISLDNARALERHFDDAFPPDVRQAVGRDAGAGIVRLGTDAGIANGTVWASVVGSDKARRYRVTEVNLGPGQPAPPRGGLQAVCETSRHRVVIDAVAGGKMRYRVWNKPHFPPAAPDLEVAAGTVTSEGTGACAHDIWTFVSGDATYTLTELRCGGEMPEDAKAELEVALHGQAARSWWCF